MSFKSLEEEKSGRRRCKFNPTSQQMLAASWPSLTLITHLVACLAMTVMILRLLNLLMLSKASSRLHPVGSKVLAPTSTKTYFDLHASDALHGLNCSCLILPKKTCFPMFFYFPRSFLLNSPCFGFLRYDARPNHCHQWVVVWRSLQHISATAALADPRHHCGTRRRAATQGDGLDGLDGLDSLSAETSGDTKSHLQRLIKFEGLQFDPLSH